MIYSKKKFKWKILKENKIYDSSWVKLYLQKIKLPNGKVIDDYHRIRIKSSVVILPVLKNKNIVTIVSYKQGLKSLARTLPAGNINNKEKPLEAAKRELLEETGFGNADKWINFGSYVANSNYFFSKINFYVALNIKKITKQKNNDLENIYIEKMSKNNLEKELKMGKIKSLTSAFLITSWFSYKNL